MRSAKGKDFGQLVDPAWNPPAEVNVQIGKIALVGTPNVGTPLANPTDLPKEPGKMAFNRRLVLGVFNVREVYADMHKDATLSHVTNTNPGELGSEFWFKLIGYGAAPLLGLMTTVLPNLPGFLFSWLQPGLSSLK